MPGLPPFTQRSVLGAVLSAVLLWHTTGCQVEVRRARTRTPIEEESYEALDVDETTIDETLTELGAPTRVEWKSGDDYLWYLYGDAVDTGIRFRIPTSFLGYQHTFFRYAEGADDLNELQLVFDEDGVLRSKKLRLSPSQREPAADPASPSWRLRVMPIVSRSFARFGDAGVRDHDDLFSEGYRAGLDIGIQPAPVFTFLVRGGYQEFGGRTVTIDGSRAAFGDLQMVDAHVGIRLSLPVAIFASFSDFEQVKRWLTDDDLARAGGLRIFIQGSTGATVTFNTTVAIDGARAGNFYDGTVVSSSSAECGLEWSWGWGAVTGSFVWQTQDAFDKGHSPLDADGSGLDTLSAAAGLSIDF